MSIRSAGEVCPKTYCDNNAFKLENMLEMKSVVYFPTAVIGNLDEHGAIGNSVMLGHPTLIQLHFGSIIVRKCLDGLIQLSTACWAALLWPRPPVRLDEMVSVLPSALGTATLKVSICSTATVSGSLEMIECLYCWDQ